MAAMPKTYIAKITTEFAAAHILRGYHGCCERLHGHNWQVEVEVKSHDLDNLGMVMDFAQIKQIANKFIKQLDHRYLNELAPFDKINPSCENIAAWLYEKIAPQIANFRAGCTIYSVTIWETTRSCVKFMHTDD
jgi:6-pyruvoyltetrahydropterin/6-carboxytetrahydropterin synthase